MDHLSMMEVSGSFWNLAISDPEVGNIVVRVMAGTAQELTPAQQVQAQLVLGQLMNFWEAGFYL
jgi:hypothetical protein